MNDFASYTGKDNGKSAQNAEQVGAEQWTAEAKKMADNFQGKSEGDLMRAIYTRAVEGKKNGTLTNEQIDMFYRQFAPMVNGVQRKKLQKVVEQLKKM